MDTKGKRRGPNIEGEAGRMFDWSLYGLLVRKMRLDAGFRKVEDFSEAVWRRTRVYLSRDTLYKIEQGRQVPDAIQFMALNLALSGDPSGGEAARMCASKEWQSILDADDVFSPQSWREENSEQAWRNATGLVGVDDLRCALSEEELLRLCTSDSAGLSKDDERLFSQEVDQKWRDALQIRYIETFGDGTSGA